MIPFDEFSRQLEGHSPLELRRMLYDLSASFERVLMAGGDAERRGRVAAASRFQHRIGVDIPKIDTAAKRLQETD